MLFYTGLFLLAVAVSFDSFFVGITYGMRKIKVSHKALITIMLCNAVVTLISMTAGKCITTFISPHITEILGDLFLIFIGLFSLFNIIRSKKNKCNEKLHKRFKKEKRKNKSKIKEINLLLSILKKPQNADLDSSSIISFKEGIFLGFALALDAFGAGLAAGIVGYSPILTSILIALMGGFFVTSGTKIGIVLTQIKILQKMAFLPPCLLITIGMLNIIF